MSRDKRGRFLTGGKPGPGRPPGSRNKLGEEFFADLCEDWKKYGASVVAKVRKNNPIAYLRIVASVIARDVPVSAPLQNSYSDLTDEELFERMRQAVADFDLDRGEPPGGPRLLLVRQAPNGC